MYWLSRSELLLGKENLEKLAKSNILMVGLGGVGSFACEFLVRAGIGNMTIIDGDVVEATNRNRQLPALVSTEGMAKTEYMATRLKDINPDINLKVINEYLEEQKMIEIFKNNQYDFVVDAIDTLTPKIALIKHTLTNKISLVSAMGAGGKRDVTQVKIRPIYQTYHCTLAQQVRKTLKKQEIEGDFLAVFSTEQPQKEHLAHVEGNPHKKSYFGTISYMPALFGTYCASAVVEGLLI
jgi:tRNA threonylcarbamoyladenosine dehydratase